MPLPVGALGIVHDTGPKAQQSLPVYALLLMGDDRDYTTMPSHSGRLLTVAVGFHVAPLDGFLAPVTEPRLGAVGVRDDEGVHRGPFGNIIKLPPRLFADATGLRVGCRGTGAVRREITICGCSRPSVVFCVLPTVRMKWWKSEQ